MLEILPTILPPPLGGEVALTPLLESVGPGAELGSEEVVGVPDSTGVVVAMEPLEAITLAWTRNPDIVNTVEVVCVPLTSTRFSVHVAFPEGGSNPHPAD